MAIRAASKRDNLRGQTFELTSMYVSILRGIAGHIGRCWVIVCSVIGSWLYIALVAEKSPLH